MTDQTEITGMLLTGIDETSSKVTVEMLIAGKSVGVVSLTPGQAAMFSANVTRYADLLLRLQAAGDQP